MIDLAYPSKHETLRVIRGMAHKRAIWPVPEIVVETPMPQSSSAALTGVVIGVEASGDKMEWLAYYAASDGVDEIYSYMPDASELTFSNPVEDRQSRIDSIRRESRVGWVDGEREFVAKLSKERQRVWKWLMGLYVTDKVPTSYDAEFDTGISHETANKTLRQYRGFHNITEG